jgi:ferredoxin
VWNRRYGRLLEIMKEQFLVDNMKGSWILHVLSRQFGEMNLQCRGSCFCGLCKEVFQELVESQRNNKQNFNAKDRQSRREFSKDLCRRGMVQGVALRMSKKLT